MGKEGGRAFAFKERTLINRIKGKKCAWTHIDLIQPDGTLIGTAGLEVGRWVLFRGRALVEEIQGRKIRSTHRLSLLPDGTLAGIVELEDGRRVPFKGDTLIEEIEGRKILYTDYITNFYHLSDGTLICRVGLEGEEKVLLLVGNTIVREIQGKKIVDVHLAGVRGDIWFGDVKLEDSRRVPFKGSAFDIYLDTKMRGMLMEHNYLSNLSDDYLKRLLLDAISALTKTKPEAREKMESENKILEYFIKKLEGPYKNNFKTTLHIKDMSEDIISIKEISSYELVNIRSESVDPFPQNIVTDIVIDKIPGKNIDELYKFSELKIDNNIIPSEKIQIDKKEIKEGGKERLEYTVKIRDIEKLNTSRSMRIEYTSEIIERIPNIYAIEALSFTRDIEVEVIHPDGIKIDGEYIASTSKPTEYVERTEKQYYKIALYGTIAPGNGIVIAWSRKNSIPVQTP